MDGNRKVSLLAMEARMKKILIFSLMAAIIVALVWAIPDNAYTITSPADGVWTNGYNYTSGFNFSWADNEKNYSATCTLYMANQTQNYALIRGTLGSSYYSQQVNQRVATVFVMNHTFPRNNTIYYWFINCRNDSNLPERNSELRTIKIDNSIPGGNVVGTSFTNNTWLTTGSLRFEMDVFDSYTRGEAINISMINSTGSHVYGSASVYNGTRANVTISFADGNYSFNVTAKDPATNYNGSLKSYIVFIDSTTPTITQTNPADGAALNQNYVQFNWTISEIYVNTMILEFNGTNQTIGLGNCTVGSDTKCAYNRTPTTGMNLAWKIYANDSAGNKGISGSRTVTADNILPNINALANWTLSSSVASYLIQVTDVSLASCKGKIYNENGTYVKTLTGTVSNSIATQNCTGTFTGEDILMDGTFRIEWNLTDSVGNINYSNVTGVVTSIYSGWNLLTSPMRKTTINYCNEIDGCSIIALFNNQYQNYTTFTKSTPGTNNATVINPGDAFLVYTNTSTYVIGNDFLPTSEATGENITIYTLGWNTMGLTKHANLSAIYSVNASTLPTLNVSWASWYNASASTFYTCSRTAGICAGTSGSAASIDMPKGYAAWVLSDLSANFTINRTKVIG